MLIGALVAASFLVGAIFAVVVITPEYYRRGRDARRWEARTRELEQTLAEWLRDETKKQIANTNAAKRLGAKAKK